MLLIGFHRHQSVKEEQSYSGWHYRGAHRVKITETDPCWHRCLLSCYLTNAWSSATPCVFLQGKERNTVHYVSFFCVRNKQMPQFKLNIEAVYIIHPTRQVFIYKKHFWKIMIWESSAYDFLFWNVALIKCVYLNWVVSHSLTFGAFIQKTRHIQEHLTRCNALTGIACVSLNLFTSGKNKLEYRNITRC